MFKHCNYGWQPSTYTAALNDQESFKVVMLVLILEPIQAQSIIIPLYNSQTQTCTS